MLWILASHVSRPLLKSFHAHKTRVSGLYTLGPALRSRIISIDELPTTEETLWLRILGREATQTQAIDCRSIMLREVSSRLNRCDCVQRQSV